MQEKEKAAGVLERAAEEGKITSTIAREVEQADPKIREALIESLALIGINTAYLADRLKQGMEAMEVVHAAKDGFFTDSQEDPDYAIRHRYLTTTLRVIGAEKPVIAKETRKVVYRSRLRGEVRDVEVQKND